MMKPVNGDNQSSQPSIFITVKQGTNYSVLDLSNDSLLGVNKFYGLHLLLMPK